MLDLIEHEYESKCNNKLIIMVDNESRDEKNQNKSKY